MNATIKFNLDKRIRALLDELAGRKLSGPETRAAFRAFLAGAIDMATVKANPRELGKLGPLHSVRYRRDGVLYEHKFKARSRPILAYDPESEHLAVVGGRYRVDRARGIIDK